MQHRRISSINHPIDISFQTLNTIYESKSEPKIEIIKIKDNGLALVIQDDIQFLESQHHHYHEVMAHTPCRYNEDVKDVLILGGGDGGICTEILKYPSVNNVTVVDISKEVVDLCIEYFPNISKGLLDPKTKIFYENACDWIKNNEDKYDLIFIDTTDFNLEDNNNTIVNPSCQKSKETNLRDSNNIFNCINSLNKNGILTFNHDFCGLESHSIYVKESFLRQKFKDTIPFKSNIPYFPGNQYCFLMCSNSPFKRFKDLNFSINNIQTEVYNRNSHLASLFISKEYESFFIEGEMDIEKC